MAAAGGLGLVCGLDWSVHNLALLALPVYAVAAAALVARRRLPAWSAVAAVAAFLAGASPYLALIAHHAQATGEHWPGRSSPPCSATTAPTCSTSRPAGRMMRVNAALAAMNFVSFLPVLAVVGWVSLRRAPGKATAWALVAITVIEVLFVGRYSVPDQFMFLLPSLVMIALAAGIGLAILARDVRRLAPGGRSRRSRVAGPAADPVRRRTGAASSSGRAGPPAPELPFRSEMRYWLVPWKHDEHSADRFARAALAQAGHDAVILVDLTVADTLRVAQKVEGLAPSVLVVDDMSPPLNDYDRDPAAFRRALAGRPMYVLSPIEGYIPKGILNDAEFDRPPGQVLYKVTWKDAALPRPASRPTSAPGFRPH